MLDLETLLNEYVEDAGMSLGRSAGYDGEYFMGGHGSALSETIMISRNYGFIRWLIKNHCIDLKKLPIRMEFYNQGDLTPRTVLDDTDILLMELSTKDNPIEYLINVLSD